jgi:hypothetical protein
LKRGLSLKDKYDRKSVWTTKRVKSDFVLLLLRFSIYNPLQANNLFYS